MFQTQREIVNIICFSKRLHPLYGSLHVGDHEFPFQVFNCLPGDNSRQLIVAPPSCIMQPGPSSILFYSTNCCLVLITKPMISQQNKIVRFITEAFIHTHRNLGASLLQQYVLNLATLERIESFVNSVLTGTVG